MNDRILKNASIAAQEAAYYDRIIEHHQGKVTKQELLRIEFICEAIEAVKDSDSCTILDLGCGRGWMAQYLAKYGSVTGVDFSPVEIDYARKTFGRNATFFLADSRSRWLGLHLEQRFDIVVTSEVIEHVPDQQAFLHQASMFLKKGGWCILTTPNGNLWSEFLTRFPRHTLQPIEEWLRPQHLASLLREAGFRIHWHEGATVQSLRFGPTAWLQNQRISALFDKVGLRRVYRRLIRKDALYQFVVAQR